MGIPGTLQQVTSPTAEERAGDFSNSRTVGGALIPIIDPSTGAPFPGNMVPSNRINPNGQALLNLLPLPNTTNRAITLGNYNYQFQETLQQFKRNHVFKIDYLPTPTDRLSFRGKTWLSSQNGYAVSSGASAWGLVQQCYCFTDTSAAVGYTKTLSPSVVLEVLGAHGTAEKSGFSKGPGNSRGLSSGRTSASMRDSGTRKSILKTSSRESPGPESPTPGTSPTITVF